MKVKNLRILSTGMQIIYGWAMSQKVSVGGCISVEETSQFNEEKAIIKSYIKKLHKRL